MFECFYNNETLLWWLLVASFITFIATLIAVPVILARLPEDYFSLPDRHRMPWSDRHPVLRIPLLLVKNLLGLMFVFAGILMLALPGQGILTIIIGLALMDFPGKYYAERWIVSRHSVLRLINWIRGKAANPALIVNFDDNHDV
ncbi:MAG: hypothetical protein KAI15_05520 [Gammaproteobacteria bacterium]|nr:hypothetical protein [Gammaproteobacteria bacterium]